MKFEWNVNPLATKVFLDDADRKYLRLAIRFDAAQDSISYRDLRDTAKTPEDAERYAKYIKGYDDITYDEDHVSAKIDESVAMYEEELLSSHCGDCVCFCCSCIKCHAESYLGIDTIKGLGQHPASKLESCFTDTSTKPWSYVERTAEDVINILSTPMKREKNEHWKNHTQEEYEKHIPRWEADRERALIWYKKYVEEHGFK